MIEAHGLTKDFGDFRAVDNVTLTVEPGTVLAMLGPNGAGKTTTVRMMTSILAPTAGTATIAGFDVVKQPSYVRAHVGVLTEQHGLYERMKAVEYLDFFGRVYRMPPEIYQKRALDLMERFDLTFALDKRLGEYSKGMKQKLALVRAMLHDPPVLLLDEPTSAMDPQSAKLVRDAIIELQHEERTFLITTHNLAEAQILADRIAIIRHGRIIADGVFSDLVRSFVGEPMMELRVNGELNGLVNDLSSMVEIDSSGIDWLRYRAPEPRKTNPELLRRVTALGVEVVTLAPVSQTLEQVYLQVVKEDEAQENLNGNNG
ncbi:MAG: ABC transporter ATP-binding protein [Chloroflexi bacterium]|nr:MAG: ABC transporter ATP-binding protein [Phototrophicales bacterium]RMF82444.1 MAG: ABC transporter ATP-binding protein [Chloroflexota bacterium]